MGFVFPEQARNLTRDILIKKYGWVSDKILEKAGDGESSFFIDTISRNMKREEVFSLRNFIKNEGFEVSTIISKDGITIDGITISW